MALPLFAAGIAAADWIAERGRLCTGRRADAVRRATLITALSALVIAPAWFQVDRTDNPITAQPLVFPHASDSGDVYWVSSAVIVALACVTLLPLAAWAAWAITRSRPRVRRGGPAAVARAAAAAALIAAVPVAAWLLHQAAGRAYASRVYATSTTLARPRPHQVAPTATASTDGRPSSPGVTPTGGASAGPVPDALAYQGAHALQDGLVGQAAGLPVAIAALLWGSGALRGGREPAETAAEGTVSQGQELASQK